MCDFEEVSLNTNYRRFASASTSTLTSFSSVSLAGDNKKDRTLSGRLSRVSSTSSLATEAPPLRPSKHKKQSNKYRNSSLNNLSKLDAIDDVPVAPQQHQQSPQQPQQQQQHQRTSRQNSVCSTQHSISPNTSPRHSRTSVYSFQSRSSVALSDSGNSNIVLPKRQPSLKEKKAANRKKMLQAHSFVDDDDEDAIDIDDLSAWNIPLAPSLYQKTRESSSKLALETLGAASHTTLPNNQQPSINHNNPLMNAPSPAMDSSANSTTSTMLSSDDPNTPDGSFSVPRIMDMSSLFDSLSPIAQELSVAFTESPKALQHEQKIELAQNRHSSGSSHSASSLSSPASCTRPSYLPPKDRKEEKKHLREYQRMVEERAAVEKAIAAKEAKRQSDRATKQRENAFRWKSEIIPNFNTAIQDPATRELWWAGVPSASRGFVWTERIGNALELSQPQFDKLSKKSSSKSVEFADVDLDTVYPELKMFGAECPYHDDLAAVLRAHSAYWAARDANANPHTAKVACAAASLILALGSPFQSWVALENLLTRGHIIKPMFARDEQALIACYTSFLKVFSTRLPSLYRHFQSQNVSPSAYLTPLVMSLFTEQFSLDVTFRIWDVMLFEGDSFMFRVALATLAKLEPYLYGSKNEIMAELQSDKLQRETEDEFMEAVRQVLRVSQ
ncbi:TBC1 domain family member 14 [Yarrowia sp. C11]|nr:TBC1 domain family member 14 [Yarrowia sp. C11]KAG5364544.1 TBC1 domain family member 14 [Yarrowia sp. E02]